MVRALLLLRRSGVRIGRRVWIGFGCLVIGIGRRPPALDIGDRAAIGPYTCFVTSSSPADSVLSQHPEVQRMIRGFAPIRVEQDAWIGAGVIVCPGVTTGRRAVVGAGPVVRQDVEPYMVVAGVPARVPRTLSREPEAGGISELETPERGEEFP